MSGSVVHANWGEPENPNPVIQKDLTEAMRNIERATREPQWGESPIRNAYATWWIQQQATEYAKRFFDIHGIPVRDQEELEGKELSVEEWEQLRQIANRQ